MAKSDDLYTEQEKIINDLREKILNERLHTIQCSISRIEDLSKKTYEQARITNGRVNLLEEADTIARIKCLEKDMIPIQSVYRNKRLIVILLSIMYVFSIPEIRSFVYELFMKAI